MTRCTMHDARQRDGQARDDSLTVLSTSNRILPRREGDWGREEPNGKTSGKMRQGCIDQRFN